MRAGIGHSRPRKEDARHLAGRGRFVGDIKMVGLREVAFVRSPLAHATIRDIAAPAGREDEVFTAARMTDAKPMRAESWLPGFKPCDYPSLASGKTRFVGQVVAMCLGDSRAEAEDLAQDVVLDLEELPAPLAGHRPGFAAKY